MNWNENYGNKSIGINVFYLIAKSRLLNYIVDFYCAKAKLIIELDGSQHHEPFHQEKDVWRDEELASLGFTVMRFSNDEVIREIWQK